MASKESRRVNLYWETVLQSTLNPKPENLVTNAQWDLLTGEPGGVDYLEIDAGGVPALWAVPHGTAQDGPALLCFHGGGYVGGSMYTHRKMFAHLAKAIGVRALSIDYTLLPQGGVFRARSSRAWPPTSGCLTRTSRPGRSRSQEIQRAVSWRWLSSCGRAVKACRFRRPRCLSHPGSTGR